MNPKQKNVLLVAAIVIIAMLLFPPFHLQLKAGTMNLGYGFLLDPPRLGGNGAPGSVNALVLAAQWFGVLMVSAIAVLIAKEK